MGNSIATALLLAFTLQVLKPEGVTDCVLRSFAKHCAELQEWLKLSLQCCAIAAR